MNLFISTYFPNISLSQLTNNFRLRLTKIQLQLLMVHLRKMKEPSVDLEILKK